MKKYAKMYFDRVRQILDDVEKTQAGAIGRVAKKMADVIITGGNVFVFGCAHAGIMAEEMFYRAGGLAVINPLFNPTLTCDVKPITLTSVMERQPGLGIGIVDGSPLKNGDILIVHSVSGRNSVPVEVAQRAKEKGVFIVALTNLDYSSRLTSRHPSGKKLYQLADIVIDNCGDFEDAAVAIDGMSQKSGATSTVIGASILHAISLTAIEYLQQQGEVPPIFHSANVDGGDEFNRNLMEKFAERIFYL
ncbi:MAG: SIS domain-containing protein [Negativicutes bacterium]|jgi:uncharacterized phosphosugar-binding protein